MPLTNPYITAIILAAGESQRMGKENKMLLKINHKPMLSRVIDNIMDSNISDAVLVLGHDSHKTKSLFNKKDLNITYNKNYKTGIASSIVQGLKLIKKETDGILICLGDMPYVTGSDINRLIKNFSINKNKCIVCPNYKGKMGNPILFSSCFLKELNTLEGDKGARNLISKNKSYIHNIPFSTDSIMIDIDNKEDKEKYTQKNSGN